MYTVPRDFRASDSSHSFPAHHRRECLTSEVRSRKCLKLIQRSRQASAAVYKSSETCHPLTNVMSMAPCAPSRPRPGETGRGPGSLLPCVLADRCVRSFVAVGGHLLALRAIAVAAHLRIVLLDGLAVELEGLLLEPRGDRARAEAVCASTNVRKGERLEEGSRILRSGEGSGAHSRRGAGGSRASAWPVARRRPAGTRSGRCSPSSPGPCAPGSNEPPCPSRGRSRRGRHGSPWCRTWGGSPTASGTWTPPGGSRRRPQWSRRGARSPSSKLRREVLKLQVGPSRL